MPEKFFISSGILGCTKLLNIGMSPGSSLHILHMHRLAIFLILGLEMIRNPSLNNER